MEIFKDCEAAILQDLAMSMKFASWEAGSYIIKAGDSAEGYLSYLSLELVKQVSHDKANSMMKCTDLALS